MLLIKTESINDFDVLRREKKNYKEEYLLCQALNGRERKLSPDSPGIPGSMHELAILYEEQDDCNKAEQLLIEVAQRLTPQN